MTPLSREILESFPLRQRRKQQNAWIALLQARHPHMQILSGGFPRCRNLIVGDVSNAKLVLASQSSNISGVIAICELMEILDSREKSQIAFVLFDHKKHAPSVFCSQHKKQLEGKLLIHIHCLSQGDTLMLAISKAARETYRNVLDRCFCPTETRGILLTRLEKTPYPQPLPQTVAVAARKRKPFTGFYRSRRPLGKECLDLQTIKLFCESIRILTKDLRSSLWN